LISLGPLDRRVDAHVARTQFGQIMELATRTNARFVVDRRGEPTVLIMSVQDAVRTVAPPPDWLTKASGGARQRGLDKVSLANIEDEIAAARQEEPGSKPE
jgi:hypothetical protein